MAKFGLTRARQELGFTPSTAVRADIDTRTGKGAVAAAVAELGGAVVDLGLKYDLKQANTELSEYQRLVGESNVRRNIEIANELDPNKHDEIFKRFSDQQKALFPANPRAEQAATIWDNRQAPRQLELLVEGKRARVEDNWRAELFNKQTAVKTSGDMGDFEAFLARGIIIDQNDPTETGRPLDKKEAARILADTRKMAEVGTITNLYGVGDFNEAKKAAKASKLLTPRERESLLNTIGAEETSLRLEQEREVKAAINAATSTALREYFTVDPVTGKSALSITSLTAQHEKGLIRDSEFKFMIKGLTTTIPASSDPFAMGIIRKARIDHNLGAISRGDADKITAENFVKLSAPDRATVFADLEDISEKIIATAESNANSEGRSLMSRAFADIGPEGLLAELEKFTQLSGKEKDDINRRFEAEIANRDLYERAVQDRYRQMRKDGITDTTKFTSESLKILLQYRKRKALSLEELEAEVSAEEQLRAFGPVLFGPPAPKPIDKMTQAEKLAELRALTR